MDRFAKIFERLILGLAAYIGMGPEIVVPGTVDQLRHLVAEIFFHQIVIVRNRCGIIAAIRQVSRHQDHIHLLFSEEFQHIFAVVHTPVAFIGIALHIAEDPDFQIWCSAHLSYLRSLDINFCQFPNKITAQRQNASRKMSCFPLFFLQFPFIKSIVKYAQTTIQQLKEKV